MIASFLPSNPQISLLSLCLTISTVYVLHLSRPSLLYTLSALNGISIVLYAVMGCVATLDGLINAIQRRQSAQSDECGPRKLFKLEIHARQRRRWIKFINNAEVQLCVTLLQTAISFGFVAISLLSLYGRNRPAVLQYINSSSSSNQSIDLDVEPTRASTTAFGLLPSSYSISLVVLLPLLMSILHLSLLAIELLSFGLLVMEIRSSRSYSFSAVDRSLASLLERDLRDLVELREEARVIFRSNGLGMKRDNVPFALDLKRAQYHGHSPRHQKGLSHGKRDSESRAISHTSSNDLAHGHSHDLSHSPTSPSMPRRRSRTASSNLSIHLMPTTPTSPTRLDARPVATAREIARRDQVRRGKARTSPELSSSASPDFSCPRRGRNGNSKLSVRFEDSLQATTSIEMKRTGPTTEVASAADAGLRSHPDYSPVQRGSPSQARPHSSSDDGVDLPPIPTKQADEERADYFAFIGSSIVSGSVSESGVGSGSSSGNDGPCRPLQVQILRSPIGGNANTLSAPSTFTSPYLTPDAQFARDSIHGLSPHPNLEPKRLPSPISVPAQRPILRWSASDTGINHYGDKLLSSMEAKCYKVIYGNSGSGAQSGWMDVRGDSYSGKEVV